MRRLYYLSRFARDLSATEIQAIGSIAEERNRARKITGFLVCLGDIFFQMLEGPDEEVIDLYHGKILKDPRHKDVVCLRNEECADGQRFPDWNMNVIDLNDPTARLPVAFREMAGTLMDALYTLNRYSQPTVTRLLEQGINPARYQPVRKPVTVMFTDLLGFTALSEKLDADHALEIVNRHFEVCESVIARHGGEVNKLIGDGLLAYFPQPSTTEALAATLAIVGILRERRSSTSDPVERLIFAGIGLSHGVVTEGNVGGRSKKEFTIMGRVVNEAARLEKLTRKLGTPVVMSRTVADLSGGFAPLRSLGPHPIRGVSEGMEVFGFADAERLDPLRIYSDIEALKTPSGSPAPDQEQD